MLRWALIFLVVAIIAGVLGFGNVAGTAASFAVILLGVPRHLRADVPIRTRGRTYPSPRLARS